MHSEAQCDVINMKGRK